MKRCLVCGESRCGPLVDFGAPPVSHHFFDGTQEELRPPMVLGQCEECGQAQLLTVAPPEWLIPRYDWLVNNEPEAHLDDLAEVLAHLPGVTPESSVCGVSHKDESLLRRLRERGFTRTRRLDLGIHNPRAGVETIQQLLQPERAAELCREAGPFDLIIARHILEHAQEPRRFLEALRELLRPNGYIVCEIPDCAAPFELLDYTTLWEEHSLYFSEATLRQCLQRGGFHVDPVLTYTAPYETAVVAIATPSVIAPAAFDPTADLDRTRRFAEAFPERRELLRALLTDERRTGKIALFGAGHHASMFTNLLGLADLIEFVVDDNPHKRGLRMPGTRLPIVGSEELLRADITLCLGSLGAGSEEKVLPKLRPFIARGGRWASIFPTQPNSPLTFRTG